MHYQIIMRRLHLLFTLTSLSVLLVTLERYSFTTKVLLQPYSFLRLHEVIQMTVIILITVLIPFFILKEVTHNFELMKSKKGTLLATIFIVGVYFYATGNGAHEIASYLFNSFCDVKRFTSTLCGSMFFNDYYFGNILYFAGAAMMTIPLLLFERSKPKNKAANRDIGLIVINATVYAVAITAYAAFDRVLVGIIYSVTITIIIDTLLLTAKKPWRQLPFTTYSAICYTLGTSVALLIRF